MKKELFENWEKANNEHHCWRWSPPHKSQRQAQQQQAKQREKKASITKEKHI